MLVLVSLVNELRDRCAKVKSACPRNCAVIAEENSIREDAKALFDLVSEMGSPDAMWVADRALDIVMSL